jgi:hypothetical protein
LCNFLHSPVTSSLLGPNILLRILFSNTLSLCCWYNYNCVKFELCVLSDFICEVAFDCSAHILTFIKFYLYTLNLSTSILFTGRLLTVSLSLTICNCQIVVNFTISPSERSDIKYTWMPSIYHNVINLVVCLSIRRGPGISMNVVMWEHGTFDN